jgi:hypothetical protein
MGRRLALVVAISVVVAGAAIWVARRSNVDSASGCTTVAVHVNDIAVPDRHTPLTLEAQLTAGGRPIRGASVGFSTVQSGEPGRHIGSADTNDEGIADLTAQPIGDLERLPGERVLGYRAVFNPWNRIGGVAYCGTKSQPARIHIDP